MPRLLPLVVLLLLFNIGGIFSLIPFMDEPDRCASSRSAST
jgi:hypothetical protein